MAFALHKRAPMTNWERLLKTLKWSVCGSLLTSVLLSCAFADPLTTSSTVFIPLKKDQLPASDLVYVNQGQSRILSPEEAWQLETNSGLDLSTLDPDATTDEWIGQKTSSDSGLDQALPVNEGDSTDFLTIIKSSAGRFRFNIRTHDSSNGMTEQSAQTLTMMLGVDLHTVLLRKELLRQLGYKIPAMKYLHQVKVKFPDAATRDAFLQYQLPNGTGVGPNRWNVKNTAAGADPLELTLQDVAVTESTYFYNFAMGPAIEWTPGTTMIRPEAQRILRALAVPYGLLNVPESINQVEWQVGRVSDGSITFGTPDPANFSCSLDDALWILRRIAALTRTDITQIVNNAYYPPEIAKLLTEKLVARRDSMVHLFGLNTTPDISFTTAINAGPNSTLIKNGKVILQIWPGYASHFAWTDPQSPLHGIKWYILSELASNGMSNLLDEANSKIPQLSIIGDTKSHENQLIQTATNQYLSTGAIQNVNFGAWVAPILNGQVNISRDVVLGNYLGENNLIQLADTFGFSATAGLMVGFDGLPAWGKISGLAEGSLSISFTRVKPLTALKQGITEPLDHLFVPWIFKHASGIFKSVEDAKTNPSIKTPEDLQKALVADLNDLEKFLNVGESLILTESMSGLQQLSGGVQASLPVSPSVSVTGEADELVISRLNFYRKDASTIQVFKDNGKLADATLAFEVGVSTGASAAATFPVLSITGKVYGGVGKSKIFSVNIDPNSPGVYAASAGLSAALKTGSVEVLESQQKPTKLAVRFMDDESSFQFFNLIHRTLKTNAKISVETPDGATGAFVYLTNGKQSGKHFQQFVTQIGTYLAQQLSGVSTLSINTQANSNPGQSFLGSSHTRNAKFSARLNPGITVPWAGIEYRWEGWNMPQKDIITLTNDLSKQYGFTLYNNGFVSDTKSIRMYDLSLQINLYQSAFDHLLAMDVNTQKSIMKKYADQSRCDMVYDDLSETTNEQLSTCGVLDKLDSALTQMRKHPSDPNTVAGLYLQIATNLEQAVSFQDMIQLVGGTANIYVSASLSGYRDGSEIRSDTLYSNTFGTSDPNSPYGIVDSVENQLGLQDGEFDMQWLRDIL